MAALPGVGAQPAIPEPSELLKPRAEVRKLFAAELRTPPEGPSELVRKLLEAGAGTEGDPPTRYACFDEALDVAVSAGAADLATQVADMVASHFDISESDARANALARLVRARLTSEQAAELAEAWLALIADIRNAGDYDRAYRLLPGADAAAGRARDRTLANAVAASRRDIATLRRAWASLATARQTLSQSPDEPAANLAMGRFLCFMKGDWLTGVPMLAKGPDAALKAVAQKDFAGAAEPDSMVTVGDAWWDLAARQRDPSASKAMALRAAVWYDRALPQLSGLMKVRCDKRIEESGLRLQGSPGFNASASAAAIKKLCRDRSLLAYASFDRPTVTQEGGETFVMNMADKGSKGRLAPGASAAPGKLGEGMLFGTQQARLRFGWEPPRDPNYTAMAWAKWPKAPVDGVIVANPQWHLCVAKAKLGMGNSQIGLHFAKNRDGSALELAPGRWYHLAVTHGDKTVKIHVNAVPVLSVKVAESAQKAGSGSVDMGGGSWTGATPCKAILDEAYIFARILSEGEIKAYYRATAGAPTK